MNKHLFRILTETYPFGTLREEIKITRHCEDSVLYSRNLIQHTHFKTGVSIRLRIYSHDVSGKLGFENFSTIDASTLATISTSAARNIRSPPQISASVCDTRRTYPLPNRSKCRTPPAASFSGPWRHT